MIPADIDWRDGKPFNRNYNDIYFSDHHGDGGAADVGQFFLQPARIAAKAAARGQHPSQGPLVVAELGFGSGLNFVVCADLVLQQPQASLHFISFERHPFTPAQWQHVYTQRSRQWPLYRELQQQPLPFLPGWQRRHFAGGRVLLSVFHGAADDGLRQLQMRARQPVDAWLLDGFAPDKNPSLWAPELFARMAELSAEGATVATFTAAGAVRRGLQAAGFAVQRCPQQPYKRESLCGELRRVPQRRRLEVPSRVLVYGAGLAGATVARQLAEQQLDVTVVDPQPPARGGSRIEAAMLHGRLLGDGSAQAGLRVQAYHHAVAFYQRFKGVRASGALQVCGPNMDPGKLQRIHDAYSGEHQPWITALSRTEAARQAGCDVPSQALWFSNAAVVNIPQLCRDLLDHPRIEYRPQPPGPLPDAPRVLCMGTATRAVAGLEWLEIHDVYGQLDRYSRSPGGPRVPVVGNGYYLPLTEPPAAAPNGCVLGATYEHAPWTPVRASARNLQLNRHYFQQPPLWRGRSRAPRCVSSDRVPLVGRTDGAAGAAGEGSVQWVATGFGSMGTSMVPLAAAVITSRICGWVPPLDEAAEQLLQPQRFLTRQARRGFRSGGR